MKRKQNNNEDNYYYTRTRKKGVLGLGIILSFFALTIVFGFLLSPLFGVGYLGNLFSSDYKKCVKTCYAVVCTSELEDETSATKLAQNLRSRGGAGIIEKVDKNYIVYLGIYLTKKDANLVCENLKEQNFESSVTELKIYKPRINDLTSEEQDNFNKSFDFLIESIDTIYTLLHQFETDEITNLTLNLRLNALVLSAEYYNQKLIESSSDLIKELNTIMASVASILKYVADEETLTNNSFPYASEVRRCLARITLMLV